MRRNLILIFVLASVLLFGIKAISAQFTIKVPKLPKVEKPKQDNTVLDQPKGDDAGSSQATTTVVKSGSKQIYENPRPPAAPVFLKNSLYVQTKVHDEYWKTAGERDHSSWVPLIRFSLFYDNVKPLNYTVEYFNPDLTPLYSEKLERTALSGDRTVLYQSPSPYGGVLDTKSTDKTGVFLFKITEDDSKQILFQGRFRVEKVSRANRPQEKNKFDFYVEHDWLAPFGTVGFDYSDSFEIGGFMPKVSVWLNGLIEREELEGRLFYKGQQIASTNEKGGIVTANDERKSGYAAAFAPQTIWNRWQFEWNNFRVDNNGTFNRDYYPNAHYADKNPGEYTVKIYRRGTQIRELNFTVGADGRFAAPGYSNELPMTYYRIVLPVKIIGTPDKFDPNAWKTDAFYFNPPEGFSAR